MLAFLTKGNSKPIESKYAAASRLGLQARAAKLAQSVKKAAEIASVGSKRAELQTARNLDKAPIQGKVRFDADAKLNMVQVFRHLGPQAGHRKLIAEYECTDVIPPAISTVRSWVQKAIKVEKKLAKHNSDAMLPPPSKDALAEAALSVLGDGRADGNKAVPQDAIDFVRQWANDQVSKEVEFQRNNLRDELLVFLTEFYPTIVKSPGNPLGWFTGSDAFMRDLERGAHLSRRKISTAGSSENLPPGLSESSVKELMRARLASIVYSDPDRPIPAALTLGGDETGIHLLPSSGYSLAPTGCKSVRREGFGDKRQITCFLAHSFAGEILPVQLIFKGSTSRVLPELDPVLVRKHKAVLTCTHNHWSNDGSMIDWLRLIAIPYLLAKKRELCLAPDYPCLVVWDVWHAHRSEVVRNFIAQKAPWLRLLYVIARCTSILQVCDVSLNKPLKASVERKTREWRIRHRVEGTYSTKIRFLRQQTARATIEAAAELDPEFVFAGARKAGIAAVWDVTDGGKEEALAAAESLAAGGLLWSPTSTRDMVSTAGNPHEVQLGPDARQHAVPQPSVSDDGQLLPAAAASSAPAASASGGSAGGTKRTRDQDSPSQVRQYTCGYCKEPGHRVAACPEMTAGRPPHPKARRSVLSRLGRAAGQAQTHQ